MGSQSNRALENILIIFHMFYVNMTGTLVSMYIQSFAFFLILELISGAGVTPGTTTGPTCSRPSLP